MSEERDAANRIPITVSVMLATMLNSIDTTIANVALPHIQGSVSASQDQITWVLTSYIVATAIMTPASGWLADRIGRKRMLLISIVSFTCASALCGFATSLWQLVLFRIIQGAAGAALMPMSQATMLDIYPREKHGQAMAVFGAGIVLGPLIGPVLGGILTEYLSWRWVFFINLPVGILSATGVMVFMSEKKGQNPKPFDFFGFGALVLGIGALQLVMDRGPGLEWFSSPEIWVELLIAIAAFYVFVVHSLTAQRPFFDMVLLRDRNYVIAITLGFATGVLMFAANALLPSIMQHLLGYPVLHTGIVTVWRGVGSFASMLLVGRIVTRVDNRIMVLTGLLLTCASYWEMTRFSLYMDESLFVTTGLVQGFGVGLLMVPLTTLTFATINPILRTEAAALSTVVRNIGMSVGLSFVQSTVIAEQTTTRSYYSERLVPGDPITDAYAGGRFDLSTPGGISSLGAELSRQSAMLAYVDVFRDLMLFGLICTPFILMLQPPRREAARA